ncbi:polyphenol oxidase I, chloroplastic-like [Panicum virgatum]|uniref:Tyrosinase copper-binding domain-containing protein n=1 Tax=Panicum virgatum TaxID=38727 RepID=A0A8T0QVW6_PANVG|nr:polyphenol oxidase I, chloroplastic-like [Panicum virgatum]KAG2577244.1 hypothetical protein PVAP13_6NG088100 [Panicum virgatum]
MNGAMASAACGSSTSPLLPAVAPAASAKSSACPSKKTTATFPRRTVWCRAAGGRDDDGLLWLPRRDMLSTLGGVAAGLVGYPGLASGAAVEANPVESCRKGDKVNENLVKCTDPNREFPCPPPSPAKAVDFTPESTVKRVRQPAHLLSPENQEKYKEAIAKMKALPAAHPLSFAAQAAIHESYCDGHYRYDPAEKNRPFDVHFSWIFAPWHRMYIHFYEKALGQLIGDDTFALPYWNWDAPAGMVVPPLFRDPFGNPLYNKNREQSRLDKLVDLDFLNAPTDAPLIPFDGPKDDKYEALVNKNLCTMYQQQIRGGKGARAFLGEKLCSDADARLKEINARSKKRGGQKVKRDKTKSQGSLERMAHTALHVWVGRSGPPEGTTCSADTGGVLGHNGAYTCNNDMGFLGSAGRDPLFYSHHSNVDRMWHIWSTKLGGEGFKDPEWLDASFVFYDGVENPRPVRIKFRDVLDTRNLGYTYDAESEKELPWVASKINPLVPRGKGAPRAAAPAKALAYPLTLAAGEVVEVAGVAVPAKQAGQQRVLVIQGIEYDPNVENKFDVAIGVPGDQASKVGPDHTEYAGSFAVVPSSKAGGGTLEGRITLFVDDVLDDVMGDRDTTVDVVLVPRTDEEIKLHLPPTIENQSQN